MSDQPPKPPVNVWTDYKVVVVKPGGGYFGPPDIIDAILQSVKH